ncbi:STAS-like domain-containing protein [Flavobacterium sp.]|jgi:hypothetical protein|uniref:STAS-like domain-containing protein n=1 Tax=Flavobacterium sp. TaxID=239 RepID=UPI0037BF3F6F
MDSTTNILVKDIVNNTEMNIEGVKLYCVLEKNLKQYNNIILNIDNDMVLSSSFLNSSLGNILDNYGLDRLKNSLKFKCNKNQFERISTYLHKYNEIYKK